MGSLCGAGQNPALKNQFQFQSISVQTERFSRIKAKSPLRTSSGLRTSGMSSEGASVMRSSRVTVSSSQVDGVKAVFEKDGSAPKAVEEESKGLKSIFKKQSDKSKSRQSSPLSARGDSSPLQTPACPSPDLPEDKPASSANLYQNPFSPVAEKNANSSFFQSPFRATHPKSENLTELLSLTHNNPNKEGTEDPSFFSPFSPISQNKYQACSPQPPLVNKQLFWNGKTCNRLARDFSYGWGLFKDILSQNLWYVSWLWFN